MLGIRHEQWLRDAGGAIAARRNALTVGAETPRDTLVFALWMTSDSMRRAGDLTWVREAYPAFRTEASKAAQTLELPLATAAFSGSEGALERRFFALFDDLCRELRDAEGLAAA